MTWSKFDDYVATVLSPRLRVELKAFDCLDVIWDRYGPKSIKGSTRNTRADGPGGVTRQHIAGNAKIPQGKNTWETFLADSSNKEELLSFCPVRQLKTNSIPTAMMYT